MTATQRELTRDEARRLADTLRPYLPILRAAALREKAAAAAKEAA